MSDGGVQLGSLTVDHDTTAVAGAILAAVGLVAVAWFVRPRPRTGVEVPVARLRAIACAAIGLLGLLVLVCALNALDVFWAGIGVLGLPLVAAAFFLRAADLVLEAKQRTGDLPADAPARYS